MHDPYIIDLKAPPVFLAFWKMAICIMYCVGREGGSIIQHRLFDDFSLEVSGPFGFPSLTLLQPFTDPLDITSVTNWMANITRSVHCMSLSKSVYVCVFFKQQASSGQVLTWLILYRDILRNLLGIVCFSEDGAEEMGGSQITSNEANII